MTRPVASGSSRSQRWLVVLIAIASLGTTALIVINVLSRYTPDARTFPDELRGGLLAPILDQQEPPVLVTLPPFALTDQLGNSFGSRQLRGKVWLASFIFTRCAGPCPMMTSQMAQFHQRLADHPHRDRIRLVSISVDPEYDTPAVLKEYARLAHADARFWRFLTGTRTYIWQLVREGFKLPVDTAPGNTKSPIFHSQKFVLVDQAGRVRGFYDGLTPQGQERLWMDLQRIVQEPNASEATADHPNRSP